MADEVDNANEIEGQSTDRELDRIRAENPDPAGHSTEPRFHHPGEPRTNAEVDQWVKQQTSIRPKKPLPKE
jgi:hypothetical protein